MEMWRHLQFTQKTTQFPKVQLSAASTPACAESWKEETVRRSCPLPAPLLARPESALSLHLPWLSPAVSSLLSQEGQQPQEVHT